MCPLCSAISTFFWVVDFGSSSSVYNPLTNLLFEILPVLPLLFKVFISALALAFSPLGAFTYSSRSATAGVVLITFKVLAKAYCMQRLDTS